MNAPEPDVPSFVTITSVRMEPDIQTSSRVRTSAARADPQRRGCLRCPDDGEAYKPALPPDRAVRELRAEAAKGWKFEEIVEEFAALAGQGEFGHLTAERASAPRLERWRTSM